MEVKRNDIVQDREHKIKLQLPVALDNYIFAEKKAENFNPKVLAEYKKLKTELIQGLSQGNDIRSNCRGLVRLFDIEADPRRLELNIKEIYNELKIQNSTLWEKCSQGLEKGKVSFQKFKEWGNICWGAITYYCWDKEKGTEYINKAIESAQDSENGSILGTKDEFLSKRYWDKSLKEMFFDKEFWNEAFSLVGVNHALSAVVEPILTPVEELGKEFTYRLSWVGYNALQTSFGESRVSYEQFLTELEVGDNSQLNIIKGSLEALEAFGIAYCMVASGGAGAASRLSRLSRLQKFASNSKDALKLLFLSPTSPVLMSFLGALGQVLQDKNVTSVNSSEFAGDVFKATLRDTSQNMHFMGFLSGLSRVSIFAQSFLIRKKAQQEIDALVATSAAKEVISLRYEKFAKDTEKAVFFTHSLMEYSDTIEGFPDFVSSLHNVSNKALNLLAEPTAENKRYFLGSLCELSSSFIDLVDFSHNGEKERITKLAKRDLALKDKKSVKDLWTSLDGDSKHSPLAFYDRRNDIRVTSAVSKNQTIEEKAAALYFTLHEDMHRIIARTEGGLREILLADNYSEATEVVKLKNILKDNLGINYQEILTSDNQLAKEQLEELVCYLFATEELSNWAKQKNLKVQMDVGFVSISFAESKAVFQAAANFYARLHLFVQSSHGQLSSNSNLVAAEEPRNSKEQNIYEQIKSLSNLERDDVMDSLIDAAREYFFDDQDILFSLSAAGREVIIADADQDKIYARLRLLCRTAEMLRISNESLVGEILEQVYYSNGKDDKLSSEIKERDVLIRIRTLVHIAQVNENIIGRVIRMVLCRYLSLLCQSDDYEVEKNFVASRIRELRQREYFSDEDYDHAIRRTVIEQTCSSGIGNLYRFIFSEDELKQSLPKVSISLATFREDLLRGLKVWFVQEKDFQPSDEILNRLENIVGNNKIVVQAMLQEARSAAIVDLLNTYDQTKDFHLLLRALALAEFSTSLINRKVENKELEEACVKAIGRYLLVALEAGDGALYLKTVVDAVIERFCPTTAKEIALEAISRFLKECFSFNAQSNAGFKNKERISETIKELIDEYEISAEELVQLGTQSIKAIAREISPKIYEDNQFRMNLLLQAVVELLAINSRIRESLACAVQAEHYLANFKFLLLIGDISRAENCYFEARENDYRIDKLINENSMAAILLVKIFISKELSKIRGTKGVTGEYLFFWDDAWKNIKKLVLLLNMADLNALFQEVIKDPEIQHQLIYSAAVQIYSGERENALRLACLNANQELLLSLIDKDKPYYIDIGFSDQSLIDQIVYLAEEMALEEAIKQGESIKIQEILSCIEFNKQRLGKVAKKVLNRAFYLGIAYQEHVTDLVQKYELQKYEVLECAAQAIAKLQKRNKNRKGIKKIVRVIERLYQEGVGETKITIRKELVGKLVEKLLKSKKSVKRKIEFTQDFCITYRVSAEDFNRIILNRIIDFAESGNENAALIILENWLERSLVGDFFIATIANRRPLNQNIKFQVNISNLFISNKAVVWNLCARAFAARIAVNRAELNVQDQEVAEKLAKQLTIPGFISEANKRALAEIIKSNNNGTDFPLILIRQLRVGSKLAENAEGDSQIDNRCLDYVHSEIMKVINSLLFPNIAKQKDWLEYLCELIKVSQCPNDIIIEAIAVEVSSCLPDYLKEKKRKGNGVFTVNIAESVDRQLQKSEYDEFVKKITSILVELNGINQELSSKVAIGIIAGVVELIGSADWTVGISEDVIALIDHLAEVASSGDGEVQHRIRAEGVISGGIKAVLFHPQADLVQVQKRVNSYGTLFEQERETFYRELFVQMLKSGKRLEKIKETIKYLSTKLPQKEITSLFIESSLNIASDHLLPTETKYRRLKRLFNLAETFAPGANVKERALYYILTRRTLIIKSKINALDSQVETARLQIQLLKSEELSFFKGLRVSCDCSSSVWESIVNSAQMMMLFQTLDLNNLELLKELTSKNKEELSFPLSEGTINSIVFDLIEDRVIEEGEYIGNLLFQVRALQQKNPLQYSVCKSVLEKVVNYLDINGRCFEAQDIRAEINSIEGEFNRKFDLIAARISKLVNITGDFHSLENLRNKVGWAVFDYLVCKQAREQLYISDRVGEDALIGFQLFCYEKGWAVAGAIEEIRNREGDKVNEFNLSLLNLVAERRYADLINLIDETTGLAAIGENSFLAVAIQSAICKLTDNYHTNLDQDAFLAILSLLNSKEIVCGVSTKEVPKEIYLVLLVIDSKLQKDNDPQLLSAKDKLLAIWNKFDPKKYRKLLRQMYRGSFFTNNLEQLQLIEKILCPNGKGKEKIGINIFTKALLANRTQDLITAVRYFKLSNTQICQQIVQQAVKALSEKKYEEALRLTKISALFGELQEEMAKAVFINWFNDCLFKHDIDNFPNQAEIFFDLYGFSRIQSKQVLQSIYEDLSTMISENSVGLMELFRQLFPAVRDVFIHAAVDTSRAAEDLNSIEESSKRGEVLTDIVNLIIKKKFKAAQELAKSNNIEGEFDNCLREAIETLISDSIDDIPTLSYKRREIRLRLKRIKEIVDNFEIKNSHLEITKGLIGCLFADNGARHFQAMETLYDIYSRKSFAIFVNNLSIEEFAAHLVNHALGQLDPKQPLIQKVRTVCSFIGVINQSQDLIIEGFYNQLIFYFEEEEYAVVRKTIYALPTREAVKKLVIFSLSKKEEGNKNVGLVKFVIDYCVLSDQEIRDCLVEGYANYIASNGLTVGYKLELLEEFKRLEINNAEFSSETLKRAIEIRLEKSAELNTEQLLDAEQETLSLIWFYIGAYGELLVGEEFIGKSLLNYKKKILETKNEEQREKVIKSCNEIISMFEFSNQVAEFGNVTLRESIINFLVEALRQSIPIDENGRNVKDIFLAKVGSALETLGLNIVQQGSVCREVIERFLVNMDLRQLVNVDNVNLLRRSLREVARIIVSEDADKARSALYEGVDDATPGIIIKFPLLLTAKEEKRIYKALKKIGRMDSYSYNNLTLEAVIELLMNKEWDKLRAILNRRFQRKEKKLESKDLVRMEQRQFVMEALTQCSLRYFDRDTSVNKAVTDFIKLFDRISSQLGIELDVKVLLSEILYHCSLDILFSNDGNLKGRDLSNDRQLIEAKEIYQKLCSYFALSAEQKNSVVHELVIHLISEEHNPTTVGKLISTFYPGHYLSLIGAVFGQNKGGYDIYIFNLLEELFYLGKDENYRGAITLMNELKILYGEKDPTLLKMFKEASKWGRSGLIEGRRIVNQGEDFEPGDDTPDTNGGSGGGGGRDGSPSLLPKTPTGGGASAKKVQESNKEKEDADSEERVIMPPVLDRNEQAKPQGS